MNDKKLQYTPLSEDDMARASSDFLTFMRLRMTVREFSSSDIPIKVVKNIVSAAAFRLRNLKHFYNLLSLL